MHPPYELLGLAAPAMSEAELRALARALPAAQHAAHVSRSYRPPLALVTWHAAPVGADIERIGPAEHGFAESICSPVELELFRGLLDDDVFVTSLWASKEALAKALGDAVAYDPRRLDSPLGWADGASGRWRAWEFVPAPEHLAWLVWSDDAQKSAASASSADSTRLRAGRR